MKNYLSKEEIMKKYISKITVIALGIAVTPLMATNNSSGGGNSASGTGASANVAAQVPTGSSASAQPGGTTTGGTQTTTAGTPQTPIPAVGTVLEAPSTIVVERVQTPMTTVQIPTAGVQNQTQGGSTKVTEEAVTVSRPVESNTTGETKVVNEVSNEISRDMFIARFKDRTDSPLLIVNSAGAVEFVSPNYNWGTGYDYATPWDYYGEKYNEKGPSIEQIAICEASMKVSSLGLNNRCSQWEWIQTKCLPNYEEHFKVVYEKY